jgi:hypothetical protein
MALNDDLAERSYAPIEEGDLRRLAELAAKDRQDFFSRCPQYAPYAARVVCVALCQGAALHYVNHKNGVKDIDLWTFYARHPEIRYPWRRPVANADFGQSKFGRNAGDVGYQGRRVDLIGRDIPCAVDSDPVEAVQRYLSNPTTETAVELSQKAVVIIESSHLIGKIVWCKGPVGSESARDSKGNRIRAEKHEWPAIPRAE